MKKWKPGDPVRVVPDLREEGGIDTTDAQSPIAPVPIVRAPIAPNIGSKSVTELPKIKTFEEGEPVREVPDLREDTDTE